MERSTCRLVLNGCHAAPAKVELSLTITSGTLAAEAKARERVEGVLDLLGLREVAEQPVRGLPFGVLRMIELGRSIVTEKISPVAGSKMSAESRVAVPSEPPAINTRPSLSTAAQ